MESASSVPLIALTKQGVIEGPYIHWYHDPREPRKKVWKWASLMKFSMSMDNISHMPFNIWRLPRFLRLYKTKFSQSLRCPQNTMPQNTHSKILTKKKKKNYMSKKKKKIPCQKKNSISKKIPCPTHTHKSIPPQKFSIPILIKISMIMK